MQTLDLLGAFLFKILFSLAWLRFDEFGFPWSVVINYPLTKPISCGAYGWASLNKPKIVGEMVL